MESFAVTNASGYFGFSQECLGLGAEVELYNGTNQSYESHVISRYVRLWAIHDDFGAVSSDDSVYIDQQTGANIDLTMVGSTAEPYAFADAHWSERRLACAFDPTCPYEYLAGYGREYFPDVMHYTELPLWVPRHVDESEYYENMARWDQFVFGWDDFVRPEELSGYDPDAGLDNLQLPGISVHREQYRELLR